MTKSPDFGWVQGSAEGSATLTLAQLSPQARLMETERNFYASYPWCLNALPTVQAIVSFLGQELERLDETERDWRYAEVMTNVFLLSCSISQVIDDYLVGTRYDFSKVTKVLPHAVPVVSTIDRILSGLQRVRSLRLARLCKWRVAWEESVDEYLGMLVTGGLPDRPTLSRCRAKLTSLLETGLPAGVLRQRPRIPAAFRSQDLTHFDILMLGERFLERFPERRRPVLVVGLRTPGSYFAPLLRAYLTVEGYEDVGAITIRPTQGIGTQEEGRLKHWVKKAARVVVVDEPPVTGGTIAKAVRTLQWAGFAATDVVALVPVHPTRRDWQTNEEALAVSGIPCVVLNPEQWYKQRLLEPEAVERRLSEYFVRRGYQAVHVAVGVTTEELNTRLKDISDETFHTRIKRIYELRLRDSAGRPERLYVLAKSVGWGWFGYHGFLAADRLSEFVPPVFGLRDGILYTQWLSQGSQNGMTAEDRDRVVSRVASYVAARVRFVGLGDDPTPDLAATGRHRGLEQLGDAFAGAYQSKVAATLERPRIRRKLSRSPCPVPTLIDGKMRRLEWVNLASQPLKTDFEHHGLGKTELNVTDPAYDLAETMLHFKLSENEQRKLVARYIERSGDSGVNERLFLNKLLAGLRAMNTAAKNLTDGRLLHRHQEFNRQYVEGWNFLTLETMRFSAGFCRRPQRASWGKRIVVLDIDGVLDKTMLGFPATTAAGIRAVSLLNEHNVAVVVNTARTLVEVQEYCKAYGFSGGVAEYGSCVWDGVVGRQRVLVSPESLGELQRLRACLRDVPGVFVNDDYEYSIRAYTYDGGRTVPLPLLMVGDLMRRLRLEGLSILRTSRDTAVLAKEVDKGVGLSALLELAGQENAGTLAIGDSEADLPMFRVATQCLAPANISCREAAKALGCQIAERRYQPGLLTIVRSILHPDGRQCDSCRAVDGSWPKVKNTFLEILEVADEQRGSLLLRALLNPTILRAFER